MAEEQKPPEHTIIVKFGFNEGLNFGCGFFIAGALFSIVAAVIVMLLTGVPIL